MQPEIGEIYATTDSRKSGPSFKEEVDSRDLKIYYRDPYENKGWERLKMDIIPPFVYAGKRVQAHKSTLLSYLWYISSSDVWHYVRQIGAAEPPMENGAAAEAAGNALGAVELEGKVAVVIDADAINAETTRGNLIRRGFEKDNVHIIIVPDVDINAIEYGAVGITQELIGKIKSEIERVAPARRIDLIINNLGKARALTDNLMGLSSKFGVRYVAGPDWQSEWQEIYSSL